MKEPILITREQFEKIKEIFDSYNIDQLLWREINDTGIGTNIYVEFDPETTVKVDITDYGTW